MDTYVVVRVPINIALVKYWGKINEQLIIPTNDSISLTINALYAETEIAVGYRLKSDFVVINQKPVNLRENPRFTTEYRRLTKGHEDGPPFVSVNSTTNFTVSAGLASSAAGFAAIAYGLGQLSGLDEKIVLRLARLGSGSACRSVLPGFVHWIAGSRYDADDEMNCKTIEGPERWNQLRAIIFEFENSQKKVSSTEGMRRTFCTSELFQYRIRYSVPERIQRVKFAIKASSFEELANIIMAESNQLHAVCMDSQPPLMYLDDNSRRLIDFIVSYNDDKRAPTAAYTFDAGPNCCVFIERQNVGDFIEKFRSKFRFGKDAPDDKKVTLPLKNIFTSEVGGGPIILD